LTSRRHPDPLIDAFERGCRSDGTRPLVLASGRATTCEEITRLAALVETRLRQAQLGPGSVVGLAAPNGPAFLAGFVAVLRRGATLLLLDRGAPESATRRALERCGAAGMIDCRTTWPAGEEDFAVESWASPTAGAAATPADVIQLTSGSTGEPRGIRVSTAALLADDEALRTAMSVRPGDRLLATLPFSHRYGLSTLVVPSLARGMQLVLPDAVGPFEPLAAARSVDATVFPTVPAYLAVLLRVQDPPVLPPTLRLVISAGAPLRPETARLFRRRCARPVHVFYGASECGGIAYDREGGAAEAGTVGEPIEGVRVDLEPVAGVGARAGRVVVRSAAVAQAYVPDGDDRLGDGRFAADDLAEWNGGALALVGRLGNFINVKGKKVNPAEVERALAELSDVDDVRVLGQTRGAGGDQAVRAVVACRPGSLTVDAVLTWCRERLSEFKVPRSVVLVDRIPVDDRGKVDLAALAMVAGPAPAGRAGAGED
jgi:long-chain acyl-CoA synthetase